MSVQPPQQAPVQNRANTRQPREQKFPPSTHLYSTGRLSTIYLDWRGRCQLIVVPQQRCWKLNEFYPLDMHFMFCEIINILEQKKVRNYGMHIFQRDWDVSPHLHIRVSMPQAAYQNFVALGPIQALGVNPSPLAPPPPSLPPLNSPEVTPASAPPTAATAATSPNGDDTGYDEADQCP